MANPIATRGRNHFREGDYVHIKGMRQNGQQFVKGHIVGLSGSTAQVATGAKTYAVHVAMLVHLRDPKSEKVAARRQLELLR